MTDNVADDSTRLTDITVDMKVDIVNPCFVREVGGKAIGTAVLEFVRGGLQARLILDPHNPEAFDLANDPERCTFKLEAQVTNGCLHGAVVWLSSK